MSAAGKMCKIPSSSSSGVLVSGILLSPRAPQQCQDTTAEPGGQLELFPEGSLSWQGSEVDLCILCVLTLRENPVLNDFPTEASYKWVIVN